VKKNKAFVYALVAAVLWGSSVSVIIMVGANLNSLQIFFYTSLIAALSLFCIMGMQGKTHLLKKYKSQDYMRFAYMGFLGAFVYYVLLYSAIQSTSGQVAFLVNYT
jgi:drug/metabolite transporter (DMT)-like permease